MLLGTVAPYANRLTVAAAWRRPAARPAACTRSPPSARWSGTFLAALLLIPLDRHPPHVHRVRAGAGAGRGARRCGSRRFWSSRCSSAASLAIPPAAIGADVTGGRVIFCDRDPVPVRARRAVPRRRALAAAQRGRRRPLALPARDAISPAATGTTSWCCRSRRGRRRPPRRIAILGDAAGTVARAYGHYFPATRVDAVELDGELTAIGRRYFHLCGPAPAPLHRRRPAVAAGQPRPLRLDLPRRLPPALHPVLPAHARVLRRRRARTCTPGGMLIVNVGHLPGSERAGAGRVGHPARGLPRTWCATASAQTTRWWWPRRRPLSAGRDARRPRPGAGRPAGPAGLGRRAGSARRSAAARSTPTTWRPVEWLTDLSILRYAAGAR